MTNESDDFTIPDDPKERERHKFWTLDPLAEFQAGVVMAGDSATLPDNASAATKAGFDAARAEMVTP